MRTLLPLTLATIIALIGGCDGPKWAPATNDGCDGPKGPTAMNAGCNAPKGPAANAARQDEQETNLDRIELYRRIRACSAKVIADFGDGMAQVGTGVAVTRFGMSAAAKLVVTNAHVVSRTVKGSNELEFPPEVKVKFWQKSGEEKLDAYVMYVEWSEATRKDLAYLVVKDPHDKLVVADTGAVDVGSTVYACGNPRGEDFLIDDGVVLDPEKGKFDALEKTRLVAHDALIEAGSSGGGLFDKMGRLVGINTWLLEGRVGLAQTAEWFFRDHSIRTFSLNKGVLEVPFLESLAPGQSIRAMAIGTYSCNEALPKVNGAGMAGRVGDRRWKEHNFGAIVIDSNGGINVPGKKANVKAFNKVLLGPKGIPIVYDDAAMLDETTFVGSFRFVVNDNSIFDDGADASIEIIYIVRGERPGFGIEYARPAQKDIDEAEPYGLGVDANGFLRFYCTGVAVTKVAPMSEAGATGLRTGDIISAVSGMAFVNDKSNPLYRDKYKDLMMENYPIDVDEWPSVLARIQRGGMHFTNGNSLRVMRKEAAGKWKVYDLEVKLGEYK